MSSPCELSCLAFDSPRWDELEHAYGRATDIPALLRQLSTLPPVCRRPRALVLALERIGPPERRLLGVFCCGATRGAGTRDLSINGELHVLPVSRRRRGVEATEGRRDTR